MEERIVVFCGLEAPVLCVRSDACGFILCGKYGNVVVKENYRGRPTDAVVLEHGALTVRLARYAHVHTNENILAKPYFKED